MAPTSAIPMIQSMKSTSLEDFLFHDVVHDIPIIFSWYFIKFPSEMDHKSSQHIH